LKGGNAVVDKRLIHDVAVATTTHILEIIAGCLREEEQLDAFAEIYERVKAGIEAFEINRNRSEAASSEEEAR
jgi:hypothetical protein